jgi:glyoxylase-like metal-dependent hydrolase (beta-lactamase superfamily II)
MRRRTSCLLALAVIASPTGAQTPLAMTGRVLRANVFVISGFTNGNILAVTSDTGVLLVDAQSEKRVAAADSVLRTFTRLPVRTVIATHYHVDHIEGNPYWAGRGATLVAHRNVVPRAARDTVIADLTDDYGIWRHPAAVAEAMPSKLVDDSLTFRVGGEIVHVVHIAPAHTDGDLIVLLEHANIVHTGDILEIGGPPFIDWWSGGSLDGMIAGTDRILALTNASTTYVPGHGPPVDRAAVERYRDMLVAIRERIATGVAAGWDQAALDSAAPVDPWAQEMGGTRMAKHFARLVFFGLVRQRGK